MGVVKCPACGGMVSEMASACPHCGQPMAKRCPKCGSTNIAPISGLKKGEVPICSESLLPIRSKMIISARPADTSSVKE